MIKMNIGLKCVQFLLVLTCFNGLSKIFLSNNGRIIKSYLLSLVCNSVFIVTFIFELLNLGRIWYNPSKTFSKDFVSEKEGVVLSVGSTLYFICELIRQSWFLFYVYLVIDMKVNFFQFESQIKEMVFIQRKIKRKNTEYHILLACISLGIPFIHSLITLFLYNEIKSIWCAIHYGLLLFTSVGTFALIILFFFFVRNISICLNTFNEEVKPIEGKLKNKNWFKNEFPHRFQYSTKNNLTFIYFKRRILILKNFTRKLYNYYSFIISYVFLVSFLFFFAFLTRISVEFHVTSSDLFFQILTIIYVFVIFFVSDIPKRKVGINLFFYLKSFLLLNIYVFKFCLILLVYKISIKN